MSYWIKYRIPSIIGWVLPFVLALFLARELPFNLLFRFLSFLCLSLVLFFSEIIIAMKVVSVWNRWKEKKCGQESEDD